MDGVWAAIWALVLCLAAVTFAVALAPGPGASGEPFLKITPPQGWESLVEKPALVARYLRLDNWDSVHFFDIAMNGYRMPVGGAAAKQEDVHEYRANVTFLPSYPLAVRFVARGLGLSGQLALLVTAQAFCILFWLLFLYKLRAAGVPRGRAVAAAWLLFAFPGAFYLVAGYTESLFLAALLGFILLSDRVAEGKGYWLAGLGAAGCGIAMTASRLVGLPALLYPVARGILGRHARARMFAIAAFSALGAAGFFLYCQLRFGSWDLYFHLLETGWGQRNSLGTFLLDWRSYVPLFFFEDTHVSLNKLAVPLSLGLLVWGLIADRAAPERLALRLTGAALLYLAMAGKANSAMDGMSRYAFPVVTLAWLARVEGSGKGPLFRRKAVWVGVFVLSLASQAYLLRRFLLGHWVS